MPSDSPFKSGNRLEKERVRRWLPGGTVHRIHLLATWPPPRRNSSPIHLPLANSRWLGGGGVDLEIESSSLTHRSPLGSGGQGERVVQGEPFIRHSHLFSFGSG